MRALQYLRILYRRLAAASSKLIFPSESFLPAAGVFISVLISLISVAVIWLGAWHLANVDTKRAADSAFRDTANLARAFEEHIIRLIQAHDQILLFIRSSLATNLRLDLQQWARDQKFANDAALQIAIANKDGILTASSLGLTSTPTSVSDREHFQAHVKPDRDELFISIPVLGRVSHKWSIHLTRRISAPDGSFGGVVTIAIDPFYLAAFYESVDLRRHGMVLLAGLDGIVRARVASGTHTLGHSIKSGRLFKKLAQANVGSYITDGMLDGNSRLTSYRKVKGYPLVVAVGLAESDVLAGVKQNRILYYGVAALVSILVLLFTTMLVKRQIAMQRARDRLWETANIDALTGLSNRNRVHEAVSAIVADPRLNSERLALLLLDLDNFKFINDTLGHEAGDIVLRTAAKRIKRTARGAHLIARLGGDEFALLLRNSPEEREIEELAGTILRTLKRKMSYRGHSIELSTSIGIAYFPDHAATWNDIFRAADLALYRAKQVGRNRAIVFDPAMLVEAETRFGILETVRSAISRGQVTPFYQPKIAIETGQVVGFEALVRIVRDDGCIDLPREFTSALEDPEVARALGLAMIERVAADMKVWLDANLDISVAINVSTTELRSDDYVERLLAVLRSNQIPTNRFEIEVTETAAFDDEAIGHNLHALAMSGISAALDDFGTGFASLTHLKSLPITQVKIDCSFVANILTDPEYRSIVGAIIDLSHNLGKSVVAEGVENEAQLDALSRLGCGIAQGFLFAGPMPCNEVAAFLLRNAVRRYAPHRFGPAEPHLADSPAELRAS